MNEKQMVGNYCFSINKAKADKSKQLRLKRRFRRYCVYLGDAHRQDARWAEALFDYGTKERAFRDFPQTDRTVQLSLFGGEDRG